ncbi:hypothetical protein Adt_33364 [Abeliophyllum distichum]|uniref:Uncharacterized protein n=1 Tax=Abeliophyllum distichum TaxID=126358 RepID=A0ABD1QXZ1_9LAMI
MEVNGMQPNEEERGASYLAGLFGCARPSATHDDDSDFVDTPPPNRNVGLKELRIISQQTNLKSDIRTLHREINAKLDNFIDELRTKVPSKLDSLMEVHDTQMVVFNDHEEFSRTAAFDYNGPTDSTGEISDVVHAANLHSQVRNTYQNDNVSIFDPLEDSFYTEVEMKQVAEIIKSVEVLDKS